jgi:hypothetical protein
MALDISNIILEVSTLMILAAGNANVDVDTSSMLDVDKKSF